MKENACGTCSADTEDEFCHECNHEEYTDETVYEETSIEFSSLMYEEDDF